MTHHYGQKITPHHLSGEGLKIKLVSTETYPLGITLNEFSNDVTAEPPTAADFRAVTVLNVIGREVEVESYHGIYVAIHVEPASRESRSLSILHELSETRRSGPEFIVAYVEYANGEKYVFSGGVILKSEVTEYNSAFFFHFRMMKRVSEQAWNEFHAAALESTT